MKTSKRAQWKPNDNNGIPNVSITYSAILLINDSTPITAIEIACWTQEQRNEVYDWAMRIHFKASDNSHVRVPDTPNFLGKYK